MNDTAESDFCLAAGLVRDAGSLAARMLAGGIETEYKTSVSDVVSAADRAAEELVARRLHEQRPQDGIVGEEGSARHGERTWYVDPVDGTYNFLAGLPLWCSALALTKGETVMLGAIYQPSTDELWLGGHDWTTMRNGVPVAPLIDQALSDIAVFSYLHPTTIPDADLREPWLRVISAAATVRMLGSGSIELAAVAAGRIGLWLQHDSKPWDWLPGAALVRAAGGAAEIIEVDNVRWHLAGSRQAVDEAAAALLT